jgi:uncharacterized protein YuzE
MTKIHYDFDYDILYIESDKPEPVEYEPISDDVCVGITSDGRTVCALVFDYSQKNKEWLGAVLPDELSEKLKCGWRSETNATEQ